MWLNVLYCVVCGVFRGYVCDVECIMVSVVVMYQYGVVSLALFVCVGWCMPAVCLSRCGRRCPSCSPGGLHAHFVAPASRGYSARLGGAEAARGRPAIRGCVLRCERCRQVHQPG